MSLVETEKTVAKDPVCGMTVDPATARRRYDYDGKTYYFCCGGCQAKFAADPAHYLAAVGAVDDRAHRARLQEAPHRTAAIPPSKTPSAA